MTVAQRDQTVVETEHARLIAYGRFAEQVGLLAALAPVPVAMKTVEHSPGEQTAESLAPVLAGGMHVDELATSPHPLVVDQPVAEAWGQTAFASASGVNGLLRSVAPATGEALQATLRRVPAPYRHRILREVSAGFLVVDLDLTGLVVGDQAATYEGAAFGDMGELDGVGRGDQFARAQLVGRTDTLVLGGVLHPGATVEARCLGELVALVEAELGRPRRRVELLEGRLGAIDRGRADREAEMARRAAGGAFLRRRQRHLETARAAPRPAG